MECIEFYTVSLQCFECNHYVYIYMTKCRPVSLFSACVYYFSVPLVQSHLLY